MKKTVFLLFGLIGYVSFLVTILYAIGFVGNLVVPKSIDSGAEGNVGSAILINVLLLGLFALQHSIMARPAFKSWWTRIIPTTIERSVYVLLTSAILLFMFWQWRPIGATVWTVDQPVVKTILTIVSLIGWALVFYSSFIIDHFDLFGLKQVVLFWQGRELPQPAFAARSLYKFVRHPLMLGFLLAFWSAPTMTQGHLLFAAVTTAYILVAIQLEERDLLKALGEDYRSYRSRTPMILPIRLGAKP